MESGVLSENEGWRLENRTCGADVRTHYRQDGGEVTKKNVVHRDGIGEVREGECHDLTSSCMSCIEIN